MLNLLRWLVRPSVLLLASGLLVAAAALAVLSTGAGPVRPQRLPLSSGDAEVAYISPATGTASWDRFVAAVRRAGERLQKRYPNLNVREAAAPSGTAAAEVALEGFAGRRLVFRWYKLTSDWTAAAWMKELLRPPYPLAVVGGNNSHWARELAVSLRDHAGAVPENSRPLLLLTTATADTVADPGDDSEVELSRIYADRTYRFSFTNRQMATAVTRFIWSQPDLRPEGDPVYLVQWTDDSYSRDLLAGYTRVLHHRATEDVLQRALFTAGAAASGLPPAALGAWPTAGTRHEGDGFPFPIRSGVGSFSSPNPYEAEVARQLLTDLRANRDGPDTRRRLLVVTGQSGQSRRFLRDVARSWPDAARRLVVAGGDAISFNTVYRDRMVTWPVQDLPYKLVFFCHRNPIHAAAGFRPLEDGPLAVRPSSHSGTDDLLLFTDAVEAVALAYGDGGALAAGLDRLHVAEGRLTPEAEGRPLFTRSARTGGMLLTAGTSEHIVCLRPRFEGERVLPAATLQVYARGGQWWRPVGDGPLSVSYVERKATGEREP